MDRSTGVKQVRGVVVVVVEAIVVVVAYAPALLPLAAAAGAKTESTILLMGGMEHMKLSNKVWELELVRIETIEFEEENLPQLEMSDQGKWQPVKDGDDDDNSDSETGASDDQGGASHDEL